MNEELLRRVIARVTQSPSCVDMGWEWDVREVFYNAVHGQTESAGFLIRCSFQRPDTNSGKVGRGWGRFFHLNEDESVTGVVKTMKLAMTRIVDHEIDEMIRYMDERIFDPHYDISDLVEMARKQRGIREPQEIETASWPTNEEIEAHYEEEGKKRT